MLVTVERDHQENLQPTHFMALRDEIPAIPNKKEYVFVFGGKIAPIFYNTLDDSASPVSDVTKLKPTRNYF